MNGRLYSAALVLVSGIASAGLAQNPSAEDPLGRHLSLAPGTAMDYAGVSVFRYKNGDGFSVESKHDVRVHSYVLGRAESGKLDLVQILRSRKNGSDAPFGVTSIGFVDLARRTGIASTRAETRNTGPRITGRLYPLIPWPLERASFVRTEPFGKGTIRRRYTTADVADTGHAEITVRLEGETPIEVGSAAGVLRLSRRSERYVIDTARGRVLERAYHSNLRFDDVHQEDELRLKLTRYAIEGRAAHARAVARFRRFERVITTMKTDAAKARALLKKAPGESTPAESGPDDLTAFVARLVERRVKYEELQRAEAARVAKLIGKPAPELTLTGLRGKELSLRALRGQIVYLTFWGVG